MGAPNREIFDIIDSLMSSHNIFSGLLVSNQLLCQDRDLKRNKKCVDPSKVFGETTSYLSIVRRLCNDKGIAGARKQSKLKIYHDIHHLF